MNLFSFFKRSQYKVLIVADVFDASYYVLLHYGLQELIKSNFIDVQLLIQNKEPEIIVKTAKSKKSDLVIFLRSSIKNGKQIIDSLKESFIKSVYLIDDDFFAIDDSLNKHASLENLEARKELLLSVDDVWASTQNLAKNLKRRFPSLRSFTFPFQPIYIETKVERNLNSEYVFGYMGSKGHKKDLEMIAPAIEKILINNPDFKFETFGTISLPERLQKYTSQIRVFPPQKNYEAFINYLPNLKWRVALAPLEDTSFNACKTFIKYLEYASAGFPIIASKSDVYSFIISGHNGISVSPHEWEEAVTSLLSNDETRETLVKNARLFSEKFSSTHQAAALKENISKVLF